jgi:hypothetical protein
VRRGDFALIFGLNEGHQAPGKGVQMCWKVVSQYEDSGDGERQSAGEGNLHVKRVSKAEKGKTEGCIQAEHLSSQMQFRF